MPDLTIPEIRDRLHELADQHGIPELHMLADATKRRYHGRAARITQHVPSPELAASIRAYAAAHPDMGMWDIGKVFGLNQGRVSEVLYGKRRVNA